MLLIDQVAFAAAEAIRAVAYAPSFEIPGRRHLADDGKIHAGRNVENAAYPAQGRWRSAIAAMIAGGGRRIPASITGPGSALSPPRGGCRQRIREFADLTSPSSPTRRRPPVTSANAPAPSAPEFWK
jgi:cytidine deaminase